VHHDIEKKYISGDSCEKSDKDSIDDFLSFAFHSIECTDPLRSEIPYKSYDKTEESKYSKVPLILSVESIGK